MAASKSMSPRMRFFFTRIFPWGFIVCGLLTIYLSARGVYRAGESLAWPVATGRIQESSVQWTPGSPNDRPGGWYRAAVLYTFAVNGKTYSGNTVNFCDWSGDSGHAQSVVDRYPKDTVVAVRYSPSNPSICVLEPGLRLQRQVWFQFGCGLVFVVFGTLVAVLLPIAMKKQPSG
jgi:hypothetical protein